MYQVNGDCARFILKFVGERERERGRETNQSLDQMLLLLFWDCP